MPDTKKRTRVGVSLFIALFAFTLLVALLAGAEAVLRLRDYAIRKALFEHSRENFQIAPYLQIKPRPNPEMGINSESFKGEPLDLSPDVFRIFTLGGSTTFSSEVPHERTYPGRLEKKLRQKYPGVKIQVENAACDWYSTQHSIIRYLFKVRHFQPHLLIMKHGINDLFRGFTADCCSLPGSHFESSYSHYFGPIYRLAELSEDPPRPPQLIIWEKAVRYFKKIPWFSNEPSQDLREFVHEYNENPGSVEVTKFRSLSVFEGNLRLMAHLAELYKSKLFFSTEPSLYRHDLTEKELSTLYFGPVHMSEKGAYPSVKSLEHGMRLFNDAIIRVGQQENVPVMDIDRLVPKTLDYLFDDVHPTEKGLEIEAQYIFEEIVRRGIIEKWIEDGKPSPPASAYRSENKLI